ncbi:succinyl-CoA--3-ketoacid-CoA transferase [Pseudonocardia sp. TMWB2A]
MDGLGLGVLLEQQRISRVTASYIGENKEFARQYLAGELELELVPQGGLAERLRSAGAGIPAFYTPAGVGTLIADGGLPLRYGPDGQVAVASSPKEVREFPTTLPDGTQRRQRYVLEEAIDIDVALVRAARGDWLGNLVLHAAARNFNPLCAIAGRIAIAEVEQLVEPGEIAPDEVHLPGVFVHRVVELSAADADLKHIEKRTTQESRR